MTHSANSRRINAPQPLNSDNGNPLGRSPVPKEIDEDYISFASQLSEDDSLPSRDRYQTALAYLGQSALSEKQLPALFRCLAQVVGITLRASHCRIWRVLFNGTAMEVLASFGCEQQTAADNLSVKAKI
ncbi:MAG: hypothetical protein ACFCBU_01855 [Cyanophyceae cyanobacterium]